MGTQTSEVSKQPVKMSRVKSLMVLQLIGTVWLMATGIVTSQDHSSNYTSSHTYGVGLDAGSSHTSLFVYRWSHHKHHVEEVLKCPESYKLRPISSFADDPSQASRELMPCLDKAKHAVPKHKHKTTPIFLGATAGMRILREVNESAAEEVMTAVRATIATYPFLFHHPQQQVRILTGIEEGTYSWIATNYLSENFDQSSQPTSTLGALDMGGASTEITFVPENTTEISRRFLTSVKFNGKEYHMYAHSYECYGLNEAYRRYLAQLVQLNNYSLLVADPCSWNDSAFTLLYEDVFRVPCTLSRHEDFKLHMKGTRFTFVGTDDYATCQNVTRQLFNMSSSCPYSHCSFNATYQPQLYGDFVGFSGFCHLKEDLHLKDKDSFDIFEDSVNNCTRILTPAQNDTNCFKVHFMYILLTDGYGFNSTSWQSLHLEHKLSGVHLGFILGMLLKMTDDDTTYLLYLSESQSLTLDVMLPLFVVFLSLFIVFLVAAFVFLCRCRRTQHVQILQEVSTSTYGAV